MYARGYGLCALAANNHASLQVRLMEEMVTQARNEASPPPERIKPVVHVTKTMKKSPRSPPADAPTSGGVAAADDLA